MDVNTQRSFWCKIVDHFVNNILPITPGSVKEKMFGGSSDLNYTLTINNGPLIVQPLKINVSKEMDPTGQ
jgi:hypothetical protein